MFFLQVAEDLFPAFIPVEAPVFVWDVFVHFPGGVHHDEFLQGVAFADLKIVRVMRRRYLDSTRSKRGLDEVIGDDRDTPMCERELNGLADQFFVPIILRIDGHCCVAQHGLRSRRCDDDKLAGRFERIPDVPEMSVAFRVVHFIVA